MKTYQSLAAIFAVCMLATTGCSKKTDAQKEVDQTIEAAKDAIDENAEKAKKELDAQRASYNTQVEMHMSRMKTYLDSLEMAYEKAKGKSKEQLRRRIAEYNVIRDTLYVGYERVRVAPVTDYDRLRRRYDSIREANEFWTPNYNTQVTKRTAADGVELKPNENR